MHQKPLKIWSCTLFVLMFAVFIYREKDRPLNFFISTIEFPSECKQIFLYPQWQINQKPTIKQWGTSSFYFQFCRSKMQNFLYQLCIFINEIESSFWLWNRKLLNKEQWKDRVVFSPSTKKKIPFDDFEWKAGEESRGRSTQSSGSTFNWLKWRSREKG